MDTKILRGTLAGGIVFFLLGWLVYGILLADFMQANYNSCANRPMEEMVWWAIIGSNLVYALLLTIVLKWSGAKGIGDGLKTGAFIAFLFAVSIDLSFYSMTTMFNSLTALAIDVVISTIMGGIIGTTIVLLWGKD